MLEQKLGDLGWERYPPADPSVIQFHQRSTVHLITVPSDFSRISTVHMYDIVVKTRNVFELDLAIVMFKAKYLFSRA
ncbi:uncharacterized protein A4U43_C05F24640 [Asparagus officinalis]|uniref:Uncharacterized protein n=1 Tax=Asparagus officinalis TaxID=4686 RepID=A0A5P1EWR3_ASPOF|nr:uncharacterized protein A4U43_C05F24640 [Asparagus officinalis]